MKKTFKDQRPVNKRVDRTRFTARQRRIFFKQWKPLCWYCGHRVHIRGFRIEHQTPLIKGGNNKKANRVVSCITCDKEKGSLSLPEYRTLVSQRISREAGFYVACIFFGECNDLTNTS